MYNIGDKFMNEFALLLACSVPTTPKKEFEFNKSFKKVIAGSFKTLKSSTFLPSSCLTQNFRWIDDTVTCYMCSQSDCSAEVFVFLERVGNCNTTQSVIKTYCLAEFVTNMCQGRKIFVTNW